MKTIKVILILAVFPFTLFSQNQEVKGALTIESTTSVGKDISGKWGEGTRLYLKGTDLSNDPVWLAKYTAQKEYTDLRVNVGDGPDVKDRFIVGTTHWETKKWYSCLVVRMDGYIGVGVENPKSKLDVNGSIRAKEVKIESTGWADFVFKPEYKLPTLSEVENHILEHGHLPDIPTENEVKENGVNMGEMQVKLLQKIEELTLYSIQQQKQIDEQNIQIRELVKLIRSKE